MSFLSLFTIRAEAQYSGLSYPRRTQPYSGWTSIIQGDTNTIGMAGATVALPNSISAMEANPAGFAMTLGGVSAQINSSTLKDPDLNRSGTDLKEYQWGLGTNTPPWGFGITYYAPSSESVMNSEVSVRELRFSVARFLSPRTSIGMALQYDKGIRHFDGNDFSSSHISFQIGALYRLENHWILGASFTPAIDISPSDDVSDASTFGFNQTIRIPSLTSVGVGFMPNRFFRAGASLTLVGGTPDTALLYDQTINYGQILTLQPRIGASYVLVDYHFIKVELAMGSYFEVSRIAGQSNRLHETFGFEVNPWFINTGIGTDVAERYKNWFVSIGIDIVRTFRTFEIIPKDTVPPLNGSFPSMLKISANGLPDSFTEGEKKTSSPVSAKQVQQIIENIPNRIEERFSSPTASHAPRSTKAKKKKKSVGKSPQSPI